MMRLARISALWLALAAPALAAENGREGLNATLWMQAAPEYAYATEQAYRAATARLPALRRKGDALVAADRAGRPSSRQPAIILDLDETVLDNTPFQAATVAGDGQYRESDWQAWIQRSGEVGLVPGARSFLRAAAAQGFRIFYVSNRECPAATAPARWPHGDCPARTATMATLQRWQLPFAGDPQALLLRNDQQGWSSKSARRQYLSARHRIAMLVGDDLGDFLPGAELAAVQASIPRGTLVSRVAQDDESALARHRHHFGDDWFLLPNPTYGSWERAVGSGAACATVPPLAGETCHAATLVTKQAALVLPQAETLRLATWNMEWLMLPATYDALAAACVAGQPPSDRHALPCPVPGRAPVARHSDADVVALARQALRLRADVVALQEVDGPGVAARVFPGYAVDCFTARAHPQKTGFAIRAGIPYRCNAELRSLDDDGRARAGADVTIWPDTPHAVRLLSVHMKSGCFAEPLDVTTNPVCARLRTQVPALEAWMDARVRDGEAFAIMGDFNRRLEIDATLAAGPDEAAPLALFAALNDNMPAGATLERATAGAAYVGCSADDHYTSYIDNVLIGRSLAARATARRFIRLAYDEPDASSHVLSDHCPLGLELRGVRPEPGH